MASLGIVLFRNDLRVHDNPVLAAALAQCATLLPLFIWDPRFVGHDSRTWHFRFPRCAGLKKRFLLESIADLKTQLQQRQSDLVVLEGDPLRVLRDTVVPLYKGDTNIKLFLSAEYTYEESLLVRQLQRHFNDVPLQLIHASTMIPPHKLPTRVDELPNVYSQFRALVEKARQFDRTVVAPPVPTPVTLKPLPTTVPASVDVWRDLASLPTQPLHSAFPWRGGESAALERMRHYFSSGKVRTYKQTRNGLVGHDYSTKFSPWLALGCLSARQIMHELSTYEETAGANESTYWVWFELLWRDYLKFLALKVGNRLFYEGGIYNKPVKWSNDLVKFQQWCDGKTGVPFVDANMRELAATGWMSNRGRQNVASFLVKDLRIDWRMGAEWFESKLLDHDPTSNYGNWLYVAGLGNDPREDRYFNVIKQAKDYDPDDEFVRQWIPELATAVPNRAMIHTPWLDPASTYPVPIVMGRGWTAHSTRSGDRHKMNGNKQEKSKGCRRDSAKAQGQATITQFFTRGAAPTK